MTKQAIRERVWSTLETEGIARFPFPVEGRIPNFAGAAEAADRLADTPEWEAAATVKANPDSPQRPVRRNALEAGKTLHMAVPRLRDAACFRRLDPAAIDDYAHATTIGGSAEVGTQVGPEAVESIDLIVAGSVAVTPDGARIGKGEGYSDLEYAILRELDLVDRATPLATTVHDRQVVDDDVPTETHDVPLDLIVTPTRTIRPDAREKPTGLLWDQLDAERVEEIPVLRTLGGGR